VNRGRGFSLFAAAANDGGPPFFRLGSGLGSGGELDRLTRDTPPSAGALTLSNPPPQAPPAATAHGGGRVRLADAATAAKDGPLTAERGGAVARTPRILRCSRLPTWSGPTAAMSPPPVRLAELEEGDTDALVRASFLLLLLLGLIFFGVPPGARKAWTPTSAVPRGNIPTATSTEVTASVCVLLLTFFGVSPGAREA